MTQRIEAMRCMALVALAAISTGGLVACVDESSGASADVSQAEPDSEAELLQMEYTMAREDLAALERAGASLEQIEQSMAKVDQTAEALLALKERDFLDKSPPQEEATVPALNTQSAPQPSLAEAEYLQFVAHCDMNNPEAVRELETLKQTMVPR